MINMTEELLSLSDAAGRLPARRAGKKTNVATLYRWAQRGHKGVRLETLQVGGTKCTSVEALQRFFEKLTSTAAATQLRGAASANSTRRIEQAERELAAAGI